MVDSIRPRELLDASLSKMTPEARNKFEADYRYFCDVSNFKPDPTGILSMLLEDWVRWAFLKGGVGMLRYEKREG